MPSFDPEFKHTGLNRLSNIEEFLTANGRGNEELAVFSHAGACTVSAGAGRFPIARACTISGVFAGIGTAPTGAALVCDVNQNGTTVFTTQANRPSIPAGSNRSTTLAVPDVQTLAVGDLLSVDIDAVGSSVAGSDLTVVVLLLPL